MNYYTNRSALRGRWGRGREVADDHQVIQAKGEQTAEHQIHLLRATIESSAGFIATRCQTDDVDESCRRIIPLSYAISAAVTNRAAPPPTSG